jgi:hypothetical protein
VKIDNLNDPLVRFCFIRSIDRNQVVGVRNVYNILDQFLIPCTTRVGQLRCGRTPVGRSNFLLGLFELFLGPVFLGTTYLRPFNHARETFSTISSNIVKNLARMKLMTSFSIENSGLITVFY